MNQLDLVWATVVWILCAVIVLGNPEASCPNGWIGPSEDFFCYFVFDRYATYDVAKAKCSSLDSHVVMPKLERQIDFIKTNVISWNNYEIWIGLYSKESGAKWEWEDGETFTKSDFQKFKKGEPDGLNSEHCVRYRSKGCDDVKCSDKYYVICQRLLLLHDCPVSWERSPSDNICYSRGYDEENNWLKTSRGTANSLCESLNSNLVMPKTESFHKFVLDTFGISSSECGGTWGHHYERQTKQQSRQWVGSGCSRRTNHFTVWIGLTDLLTEGLYQWDDGTSLETSKFWNPGEPSNSGYIFSPDCVVMWDTGIDTYWETEYCNIFASYDAHVICQCAVPLPNGSVPVGMAVCDEGYSTTEPSTPSHYTMTSQEISTSLTTTQVTTASLNKVQDEIITSTFKQGSSTTATESPPCCPCWMSRDNITQEALQSIIKDLISATKVEKKSLSSTIRKLTSANDPRPSSKSMGYTGIALIVTFLCFLLILDLVPK